MTSKQALICSWYMPQAELDSYSRRLFHFVQFLREGGWGVTCVAESSTGAEQYAATLREHGVRVHIEPWAENRSHEAFEQHVERLAMTERFDVAILGFWHIAEVVIKTLRRCSPTTRIVVDSGDLHFLRHARRIFGATGNQSNVFLDSDYAAETVRELNVYAAADAVLAVSRKEAGLVNDFIGDHKQAYFVPDCEDLAISPLPFDNRRGMFFVGNFQHLPNVEAVEFLCRDILPQFDPAALVDHPVYIVGSGMTEAVRRCGAGLPYVRMVGWVPSILPYLQRARVSLVPLLHGAGTKRKIIQALAIGTPTVSTTIGVEGFDLRNGEEVLVADDPIAFANATARLLQDPDTWWRLARQGRARIMVEHGRQEGRERLLKAISSVLANGTRPRLRSSSNGSDQSHTRDTEYQRLIQGGDNHNSTTASAGPRQCIDLKSRRPAVQRVDGISKLTEDGRKRKVLVVGVYLADRFNNIDDIVQKLSKSVACQVVQRWAALRGGPPTQRVAAATAITLNEQRAKFEILNELLDREELADFDYVLACDDDVVLPQGFLDKFIKLQSALGFRIAQPSLTSNSFINHPIVEQQRGVVGRKTSFVEIGPVVSFERSVFPLVFPFDMTSPMGWGYEQVWASQLAKHEKSMGIIDAVPVDHSLRESVSNYSWEEANGQREALFKRHEEIRVQDPFRVLGVASLTGVNGKRQLVVHETRIVKHAPRISVVIPTHNRAALLEHSLKSLSKQTLHVSEFEVIIVDDGSSDATPEVCKKWSSRLPLARLPIRQSGISAAKNLGVFAATSPIILFFDDDDIADENLLAEHLKTHALYPLENVAVLGYTDWAASLEVTEVMRFVTDIGHYLFSYSHLVDGQRLDFSYFWGGRSSCKKSLLTGTGVFRQDFEFSPEDIELAFRISKRLLKWRLHQEFEVDSHNEELKHRLSTIGLSVIFNRHAVQHMVRPLTYDDFCLRCERQGRLFWRFSSLYKDSIVHEWCQTIGAGERWQEVRGYLPEKVTRVHKIESIFSVGVASEERPNLLAELHALYWWTFDAFKLKGMAEAFEGSDRDG